MSGWQESEIVEFKEKWTERSLEDLAAFANHKGGTLYIGVSDDRKIVGTTTSDKQQKRISNLINDKLHIIPTIAIEKCEGQNIFAIHITKSPTLIHLDGRYLIRAGSTNRPMTGTELGRRAMEQRGTT